MESISPDKAAGALFAACLSGEPWPESLIEGLARQALNPDEYLAALAGRALFTGLVEPLADRFEPRLCDEYARLFARVLGHALGDLDAGALVARYGRVRAVRRPQRDPPTVFVLSRVTLGADVAVTSIVLDGARRRFPDAQIVLAGSHKAWELFEMDSRLSFLPLPYGRTSALAERLSLWPRIREMLGVPGSIVLDPDSRLTQLGLLPVCPEENHFLFESRAFGGSRSDGLPTLTAEWVRATLGIDDAQPYLAPKLQPQFGSQPVITVSLGVGENPAKRLGDPFEPELLGMLARLGPLVMVDRGAGGEEAQRVEAAIERSGAPAGRIGMHEGSFASFASLIARSVLYAGYDSAGQHVAAALGVPLISVFRGAVCDRFFQRWSPDGPGQRTVIRAEEMSPEEALEAVRAALPR